MSKIYQFKLSSLEIYLKLPARQCQTMAGGEIRTLTFKKSLLNQKYFLI
ncbi:MAG: hypothetical protein UR60_C0033G0007 [Candidatus Moranbacteria bacterium GW2011_GWF2_34_56]|nr:MAG: hypothetical protein UR51_C0011G0006 [Candidatus Moranbacteria bacterium GW2011_GWF1_34_10]KKP63958.1 MAG: hypothetical protein UR60_C0033G0007 [Candidatus Moranbacteria bacterium GW2011_GWF2_34_56]